MLWPGSHCGFWVQAEGQAQNRKHDLLEHEEQVGVVLQQPRVEALGCLNGFTYPAFQHQLLDFCRKAHGSE